MAHNQDYTKVWDTAGDSDGLSVYEVMRCLGINNQDIGAVCTSGSINKWALYKPQTNTNADAHRAMTLAERKRDNYGFDTTELSGIKVSSLASIFPNARANEYDWPYVARVAPYRLLDFSAINTGSEQNGYDKNAVRPFSATQSFIITTGSSEQMIECNLNTLAEIDPLAMGIFDTEDHWEVGAFVKYGNTTPYFAGTGHTIDGQGSNKAFYGNQETVTIDTTDTGHYYIVWGFYNRSTASPQYVYLPNTYADIYVTGLYEIMIVPTIVSPAFTWRGNSDQDVLMLYADMEAVNNDALNDGTFSLTARIYQRTTSEDYLLDTQTWNGSLEPSGSTTYELALDTQAIRSEEVALSQLYVEMQYTFTIGSNTYTRYIDCVNKSVLNSIPSDKYQATQLDIRQV